MNILVSSAPVRRGIFEETAVRVLCLCAATPGSSILLTSARYMFTRVPNGDARVLDTVVSTNIPEPFYFKRACITRTLRGYCQGRPNHTSVETRNVLTRALCVHNTNIVIIKRRLRQRRSGCHTQEYVRAVGWRRRERACAT